MSYMFKPENIRKTFGENLSALIAQKGTISSVARDLSISRTQLCRYLDGSSFPKPCMLMRISKYFNVSPEIYSTPLSKLSSNLTLPYGPSLKAPSTEILPDGIYLKWSTWRQSKDSVFLHMIQVKRIQGICRTRVFRRSPESFFAAKKDRVTVRQKNLLRENSGILFQQGNEILMIDGLGQSSNVVFATFHIGHSGDPSIFPGFRIVGGQESTSGYPTPNRVVIQRIPQRFGEIMKWARMPQMSKVDALKEDVASAFNKLSFLSSRSAMDSLLA